MTSRSLQSNWEDRVFSPRPHVGDGSSKEVGHHTLQRAEWAAWEAWLQQGSA